MHWLYIILLLLNLAIIIIVIDGYHCYQIWCCMHYVDEKLQTWLLAVMHYVFIYHRLFEQWMWNSFTVPNEGSWRLLLCRLNSSLIISSISLLHIWIHSFEGSKLFAELEIKSVEWCKSCRNFLNLLKYHCAMYVCVWNSTNMLKITLYFYELFIKQVNWRL